MPNDSQKGAGDGGRERERKSTPAIGLPTPEATIRQVAQLRVTLERTVELCRSVEKLVREGGFDARARAFMRETGEHWEEELSPIAAGTGRALRRLAAA